MAADKQRKNVAALPFRIWARFPWTGPLQNCEYCVDITGNSLF